MAPRYDDPTSNLSRWLDEVVNAIRSALDSASPGAIRLISLCSGDARDITRALGDHPRRADIVGCVVEFDRHLDSAARMNLSAIQSSVTARCGDASGPSLVSDMLPADLLLLVGMFGNVSDTDVHGSSRPFR